MKGGHIYSDFEETSPGAQAPANYHTVLNLPFLDKVIESSSQAVTGDLRGHNSVWPFQSCFRLSHVAEMALVAFTDKLHIGGSGQVSTVFTRCNSSWIWLIKICWPTRLLLLEFGGQSPFSTVRDGRWCWERKYGRLMLQCSMPWGAFLFPTLFSFYMHPSASWCELWIRVISMLMTPS